MKSGKCTILFRFPINAVWPILILVITDSQFLMILLFYLIMSFLNHISLLRIPTSL